jgi:tetratricopeptide (TPR) repeat protein
MLIQEGLKELSDDARFGLDRVFCLQRSSEVASNRGDSREAVTRALSAQRALSQSPFSPEVLKLDNLIILAGAYRHAGQVREATTAFEQASARLTALGRDNTQRAGTLFNNWGVALWLWGRPLDAERLLRRAIAIGQDSQAEATVSPMVLVNYARTLTELGRLGEAADYAERAYAKAQTAGDQTVVNQSLLVRTAIYRSQGDLERAGQMLSEVEPTLRRNLPAGHIAFASLASQRALNAQARGDLQTALDLASQAVAIAEASSKKGHLAAGYLEKFLVSRSDSQLQLGHKGRSGRRCLAGGEDVAGRGAARNAFVHARPGLPGARARSSGARQTRGIPLGVSPRGRKSGERARSGSCRNTIRPPVRGGGDPASLKQRLGSGVFALFGLRRAKNSSN